MNRKKKNCIRKKYFIIVVNLAPKNNISGYKNTINKNGDMRLFFSFFEVNRLILINRMRQNNRYKNKYP